MTAREYQDLVDQIDALSIVVDLAQRQVHALRTRLETIADKADLLPQAHLPLPPCAVKGHRA